MLTLLREAAYMALHLKLFGSDVAMLQPYKLRPYSVLGKAQFRNF
jgi:hypothetical protein